jgi:hypothetical protein
MMFQTYLTSTSAPNAAVMRSPMNRRALLKQVVDGP